MSNIMRNYYMIMPFTCSLFTFFWSWNELKVDNQWQSRYLPFRFLIIYSWPTLGLFFSANKRLKSKIPIEQVNQGAILPRPDVESMRRGNRSRFKQDGARLGAKGGRVCPCLWCGL